MDPDPAFQSKSGIDWFGLFFDFCAVLRPASAVLHQFPPQEIKSLDYHRFDSAVVGEHAFTARVAEDGNKVRVDRRKRTWPRQFTFLPELAWANHLGPELSGTYDTAAVMNKAAASWPDGHGLLFRITNQLEDVTDNHEQFSANVSA